MVGVVAGGPLLARLWRPPLPTPARERRRWWRTRCAHCGYSTAWP